MRTHKLRVAMAQMNATVGDLEGNAARILRFIQEAKDLGADLVTFPEMALTGYPPEDLLLKPQFLRDNAECLQRRIVPATKDIAAVVGFVDSDGDIFNGAAVLYDGHMAGIYHKSYLPNYGVFDEYRYFKSGTECPVFILHGIGIGVNICEDIWYPTGPHTLQSHAGAEVIVNINSSPYHAGKLSIRERMLSTRASDELVFVVYTNMVGGQDELVFDGGSMILNERGEVVARAKQFEEDLVVADVDLERVFRARLHDPRRRTERLPRLDSLGSVRKLMVTEEAPRHPKPALSQKTFQPLERAAEVFAALVIGTRDYVHKNGFRKVIIGLSGGIDSSLVAVIAADALGPENVVGVAMPSQFNAPASLEDAQALAGNLGLPCLSIPIQETFSANLRMLAEAFRGTQPGVAEENLQARIRGNTLMALSNKFGYLVLTTGNKSELATGYSTLYGDMAGGFAVIKDVPKTLVYELARYRNSQGPSPVIPQRVLDKEPSAELRFNQRDSDTLPPYPVLDPILQAYVEEDRSFDEIVALGYPEEVVKRVIAMVDRNEYKRRQAAPGIKITPRAFGRDRRLPIVNAYRGF
ncbi:MAG: NAD+ synthase [Chloroflexota bacterium]|nr:NAD+ synthase [Chloroflexota bacterium]